MTEQLMEDLVYIAGKKVGRRVYNNCRAAFTDAGLCSSQDSHISQSSVDLLLKLANEPEAVKLLRQFVQSRTSPRRLGKPSAAYLIDALKRGERFVSKITS